MSGRNSQKPVALITGASAGIGAATARRFARGGFRLVAVARGQERLSGLARDLSKTTEIEILALDVANRDSGDRAVDLAMKRFGRLDCLVNNAGSNKWAPIDRTDDDMMDEVVEVSLKAPFRFSRAAVRVMGPGSSIINVGSTFGLIGGLNGGIYSVAKAGLTGLTQSIAVQYGAKGIRSNLVAPGVIKTEMIEDVWETERFRRVNQEMTPFDRDGTPEDVANAIYFFASEEGSYFNGQCIALDGGWSATKFLSREAVLAKRVGG